jgi:hypothetical protein
MLLRCVRVRRCDVPSRYCHSGSLSLARTEYAHAVRAVRKRTAVPSGRRAHAHTGQTSTAGLVSTGSRFVHWRLRKEVNRPVGRTEALSAA